MSGPCDRLLRFRLELEQSYLVGVDAGTAKVLAELTMEKLRHSALVGHSVPLSSSECWDTQKRDCRIYQLRADEGLPPSILAQRFGLDRSTIHRIVKKMLLLYREMAA